MVNVNNKKIITYKKTHTLKLYILQLKQHIIIIMMIMTIVIMLIIIIIMTLFVKAAKHFSRY
jgi:uncharacterized membrane protein